MWSMPKRKQSATSGKSACLTSVMKAGTNSRQMNIPSFFTPTNHCISRGTKAKQAMRMTCSETNLRPGRVSSLFVANKDGSKKTSSRKTLTQMYLDFGQKSFAQNTVCKICGMLFVHGIAEDQETHQKVCQNFTLGIPLHGAMAYRVIGPPSKFKISATCKKKGEGIIIEVRPSDPNYIRKKAAAAQEIAHKEMGIYTCEITEKQRQTSFLFVKDNRIIGLLIVEPITKAFPFCPDTLDRSTNPVSAKMGVYTIWVHAQFRGQLIGSQLLDAARTKFLYGTCFLPLEEIAFSSPTNAGIAFAMRYMQQERGANGRDSLDLLVYDFV